MQKMFKVINIKAQNIYDFEGNIIINPHVFLEIQLYFKHHLTN